MRRLEMLLATAALLVGGAALPACGSTVPTAEFVTSGDCPREHSLVRRALERSPLRADVSGDGRLDRVAVATDEDAPKRCRAFVAVRVRGGPTFSTHLYPGAVPLTGLRAKVIGLLLLGDEPGARIVVDTNAAVDAVLAQMFTLTSTGLRRVHVPVFDDGTFIVEGGGVIYPYGAACTEDGHMVLSRAAQSRDGKRFRVTRRIYAVRGERARFVDPDRTRATVPLDRLVERFPEFTRPHWKACAAPLRG